MTAGAAALVEGEGLKRPLRFFWDASYAALDFVPRELLSYYEDLPVNPLTRTLDSLDHTGSTTTTTTDEGSFFDRITRTMSPQAYLEYAECRQASFTFKKLKKFREWLTPQHLTDYRVGDDCMELLGFVAWELTQRLAMRALHLQSRAKLQRKKEELRVERGGPFSAKSKRESKQEGEDGADAQAALVPSFLLESYREYRKSQSRQTYYKRFFC